MQVPENQAINFFLPSWSKLRLQGQEFHQTIVTVEPFQLLSVGIHSIPMAGCLVPSIWGHFGPFGLNLDLEKFCRDLFPLLGFFGEHCLFKLHLTSNSGETGVKIASSHCCNCSRKSFSFPSQDERFYKSLFFFSLKCHSAAT